MLDHGVLNLPLSKRGDLRALFGVNRKQFEAQQKANAKAAAIQRKAIKAQAKELLAAHRTDIVAQHGERFGVKALTDTLDSWAKWEPAKLVAFVNKFLSEVASA